MKQFEIWENIINIASNLNSKHSDIAKALLKNSTQIKNLSITKCAKLLYTSPSTISRFCKLVGLENYSNLKFLINSIEESGIGDNEKILSSDNLLKEIFDQTKITFQKNFTLLNSQKEKIDMLVKKLITSKKILILAFSGTYRSAYDFYNKLLRLKFEVIISNDIYDSYALVQNLTEQDLLLTISFSGLTKELIKRTNQAKMNNIYTISLTNHVINQLAQVSDLSIGVYSTETSLRFLSISSRYAILFALDFILISLINVNKQYYMTILKQTTMPK